AVAENDRLAKLLVPLAKGQALAAKSSDLKVIRAQKIGDFRCIAAHGAGGTLANAARSGPGVHVDRNHSAANRSLEAVLDLRSTPLLACRMPGRGHEARTSGNRSRHPGAVWEIAPENL